MSDRFDAAAKRAAAQEKLRSSGGLTRRRVVQGAAWSVPVIAIAAPVPAFAGVSQGILQLTGTGCKLPGNSNDTYKGYAFKLSASNTTAKYQCIQVLTATLNGEDLGDVAVINLDTCHNLTDTFCLTPNGTTGSSLSNLALVTANAGSSSNGQLIVTYQVSENATSCACDDFSTAVPATASVNAVPPINGASCSAFNASQKNCLSGPLNG